IPFVEIPSRASFSCCRCSKRPARRPAPGFLRLLPNSVPPVPVPPQFKTDVGLRVGADISAARVIHILARRDGLGFGCSQCARGGGEDDGQSKCGLSEHDVSPCVAGAVSIRTYLTVPFGQI